MKLIIGGAYQGKKDYAATHYPQEPVILDFHKVVLDWIRSGENPPQYFAAHLSEYQDKILICDDISCGIVPIEPLMRRWREDLGRVLVQVAKESDEVVRVFCGLGTKIK